MAVICALWITQALEMPVPVILLVLNTALLFPAAKALRAHQELRGAMSPAIRTYNLRMLVCSVVYALTWLIASSAYGSFEAGSAALWAIAIVPLVPIIGMIWAMARYLLDEEDEYLRFRAVQGALVGLALVLVAGTVWGFLEMFELVPHVWVWAVFPLWAIGLGIGMTLNLKTGETA